MKKILLSISTIAFVGVLAVSATGAFFSDTETSTGNTFTAGAIDLTIDNESYYNGEVSTSTSWERGDLDGQLFFNFLDLKPGDWGEDTISIHVASNPAYACMDFNLTATPDNGLTEPEAADGDTTAEEGELQDAINFVWWHDDGDNVLEESEVEGVQEMTLAEMDEFSLAISDTSEDSLADGPLDGDTVEYVAKAWCLGDLELTPEADGEGDPTVASGITCNGANLDNTTQTDSVEGDITFYAVQARNNDDFRCDQRDGGDGDGDDEEGQVEVSENDGWSPEALAAGGWLAKARYGDNNPNAGAYELEVGLGAGDRDEENHGWEDGVGQSFELDYDATTGIATLTVGGSVATHDVGTSTPNSIGITAKGGTQGVTSFTNGMIDGNVLPDLVSTTSGHEHLSLSGSVVEGSFTLTGTVTLDWDTPANELPTLQVDVD